METIYTIDEIKEKTKNILKEYPVKKVILFGSYAKNNSNEKSDIDLVVDSEGKLLNINFYGLLEDLTATLDKKIDLFELSEINKNSQLYKNITKEGIVIYKQ